MVLTKEQLLTYKKNGVIKIENFWTNEEINTLINELTLIKSELQNYKGRGVSFCSNQEINAIQGPAYDNKLIKKMCNSEKVFELARNLFDEEGIIRTSEFFLKPKSVGLETCCHQDNAYWCLNDSKGFTIWTALSPCDENNGGVWYYKGSHTFGDLEHHASYKQCSSQELSNDPIYERICGKKYIFQLQPGDILVHHARTIHGSASNKSHNVRIGWTIQVKAESDTYNKEKKQQYLLELKQQLVERGQEDDNGILITKYQTRDGF